MKSRFDAERDSLWKGGLAQLAVLLRKAPARVSTSLLRFDPAIARRDRRGQRIDQRACDRRHVLHRLRKCLGIGQRGLFEATQLPHKLQRRGADLLVSRRWLKVK